MTLQEIIDSEMPINEDLIKQNKINIYSFDEETLNIKDSHGYERLLEILHVLRKLYPKVNEIRFHILYVLLKLDRFEEMLEYARNLYRSNFYRQDISIIILLLQEILETNLEDRMFFRVDDVMTKQMYGVKICVPNRVRKLIYFKEYNEARKQVGIMSNNIDMNIEEAVIYKLLNKLHYITQNKLIENIDNLDFDALDDYYASFKEKKRIDNLQMDLVNTLYNTCYGYRLPDRERIVKPRDIYDAYEEQDMEFIRENLKNNPLTSKLADKILEVNQHNIEVSFSDNNNDYVNNVLEIVYECFKTQDHLLLGETINEYLTNINRSEWINIVSHLAIKVFDDLMYSTEDEFDEKLAIFTETLVELSRPLTKKSSFYLRRKLASYLGIKEEPLHPYSNIYKYDINYNYDIDSIEELITKLYNGNLSDEEVLEFKGKEDYPYILAILAREYYRIGKMEKGDRYLNVANNYSASDKELKGFIRIIVDYRDTLPFTPYVNYLKEVKKLVRKDV